MTTKPKYDHQVCVCFSVVSESEDLIGDGKLQEILSAARERLGNLELEGEIEAFEVVDTVEATQ